MSDVDGLPSWSGIQSDGPGNGLQEPEEPEPISAKVNAVPVDQPAGRPIPPPPSEPGPDQSTSFRTTGPEPVVLDGAEQPQAGQQFGPDRSRPPQRAGVPPHESALPPHESASPPHAGAVPPKRRSRRRILSLAVLLPALVVVGGFGVGIFLADQFADRFFSRSAETVDSSLGLVNSTSDGDELEGPEVEVASEPEGNATVDSTSDGGSDDDAASDDGDGVVAGSSELPALDFQTDAGDLTEYEVRYGEGLLYLTGAIPSQEYGDVIVERAAAIIGRENLVVDHRIDPTRTLDPRKRVPVYIDDVVYFEPGSTEIAEEFYEILDLGVYLLELNKQASFTVQTFTDARGSAEDNLELSRQRAEAILAYHTSKGGNPEQILIDPRGEEGAVEGADVATRAAERRAEFTLNNFLIGLLDDI